MTNLSQPTKSGFDCSVCGSYHDTLPMSIAFATPDVVSKMLPWDKDSRCKSSEDWCIIDDNFFYIRGCLEIPVHGSSQPFVFGVWSTLGLDDFDRYMELWNDPARLKEPPYLGMLANEIPFYENTRMVQTKVHTRAVGDRPLITVPDKHRLGQEQRDGISRARVIVFAQTVLHGASDNPYAYLCER